jgi:flagellar hook-associated protein 2
MSDIYVPGVTSRFNTEKLIEDLMRVERIPRERTERNVETLQAQKTYWQELGRRMSSLRDSARLLFSFQNPFNDRIVASGDESILTGSAVREASEQERTFIVKQAAQADRFLSRPLEDNYRVDAGSYTYKVGDDEISFDFRGGTLRDFVETLNRRGRDKIHADIITVQRGTRSLIIESKVSGAENRLGFSGAAEDLAIATGMAERLHDSLRNVALTEETVRIDGQSAEVSEGTVKVYAGGQAGITVDPAIRSASNLFFTFEAATKILPEDSVPVPQPPPGPSIPGAGSVTYGGITIENDSSVVTTPEWTPPPIPPRVDDLAVIALKFTDGSAARVPVLRDSESFEAYRYPLSDLSGGKSIASIELINQNTHRDVSIRNIRVFDPDAMGGIRPKNAVSTAQDAVVSMDGIEITRPSNVIDDLIPGVTLTVKAPSDRPVKLGVVPDREGVKEAIISLVGNYNRLMAEVNVLTRRDDQLVQELSYLSADEQEEMRKRLGVFSGESSLVQFKSGLQRAAMSSYLTSLERDLSMLPQIGIGTDVRRAGASTGYDASRLRGYLEIDEKSLDAALETKLPAIQQLFGSDTDGDLIVDSGIAYSMDLLARPYVETGGIITLKTGTIDSRIAQDGRRIETLDRQLAAKEASLKNQYAQMESAYNQMERMSTSLDQFSQRSNNNNSR